MRVLGAPATVDRRRSDADEPPAADEHRPPTKSSRCHDRRFPNMSVAVSRDRPRRTVGKQDHQQQRPVPPLEARRLQQPAKQRMHRRRHPHLARQQPPKMLQSVAVPPGCGKTHLAVALGIAAVEAGYRGYFTTATDMTKTIVAAYADGTHHNKIRTYTGPSVLVIDDVGITPFDRNEANAFFQIVNRRYENRSATIVTTNRGLPAWAELFGGDSVVAAAILDRLLDNATVINIRGPSWRLREHQALTQPLADLIDTTDKPTQRSRR